MNAAPFERVDCPTCARGSTTTRFTRGAGSREPLTRTPLNSEDASVFSRTLRTLDVGIQSIGVCRALIEFG